MQTIQLELFSDHAIISFNRPEVFNSLNDVMAKEFLAAIQAVVKNTALKAVVLKGEGAVFMAGGDIGFFYQNLQSLSNTVVSVIDTVHEVITLIQQAPQIFIASVHGSVAGIGVSFMLACDLVVAAEQTKFTTAYSKIGTSPDGGSSYFLTKLLGTKKAMELLILAELFTAQQAKDWQLINFICTDNELSEVTGHLVKRICQGPNLAYQKIKALVNQAPISTLTEQLDLEKNNFTHSAHTKDFAEGVSAFVKKQKPNFTGN